MSKYNKELIGVKMLENGAVELLMKYKNLDEPKWVNFNEIDPKSLSLSLAFLDTFVKVLKDESVSRGKTEQISDSRSPATNCYGEPILQDVSVSPIEDRTRQLLSNFQKVTRSTRKHQDPWLADIVHVTAPSTVATPETAYPATEMEAATPEYTESVASKLKSEPRQMTTKQSTPACVKCAPSQGDDTSKEGNTGDAYLKTSEAMKNNMRNWLSNKGVPQMQDLLNEFDCEPPAYDNRSSFSFPRPATSPTSETLYVSHDGYVCSLPSWADYDRDSMVPLSTYLNNPPRLSKYDFL